MFTPSNTKPIIESRLSIGRPSISPKIPVAIEVILSSGTVKTASGIKIKSVYPSGPLLSSIASKIEKSKSGSIGKIASAAAMSEIKDTVKRFLGGVVLFDFIVLIIRILITTYNALNRPNYR